VPKQHIVSKFAIECFLLCGSVHLVYIRDRHFAEITFGVIEILMKQFILGIIFIKTFDAAAKLFVVLIQNGFIFITGLI